MWVLLAKLHGLVFRLALWLVMMPLKSAWALILTLVALLGEEIRRWLGVLVAGLMILAVSWAALKVASQQRFVLLAVLLMGMIWLYGVVRAAELTLANRVWRVRQRQMFRELSGNVRDLRGEMVEGMARATRGKPGGGWFRSNREADAAEAERAERERRAAEAARVAAEAEERQRQADLAAGFDPYETLTG